MNESASLLIGTPSKKPLPETSAGSIMYYNTIENVGLPPGRGDGRGCLRQRTFQGKRNGKIPKYGYKYDNCHYDRMRGGYDGQRSPVSAAPGKAHPA